MTKMTKHHSFKLLSLMTVLFLCLSLISAPAVSVFAEGGKEGRCVDNAGLLSDFEKEDVVEKLDTVSQNTQLDIAVLTTESTDGESIESYADDYFDQNDYGYGDNKDGVLLCISMDDRSWHISTSGLGMDVLSDSDVQDIGEDMSTDLSNEDYENAFCTFADDVEEYYETYQSLNSSDSRSVSDSSSDSSSVNAGEFTPMEKFAIHLPLCIFFSLIVGLVGAFFSSKAEKDQLTSVAEKTEANQYIVKDSFKLTDKKDIFLFTNTVRSRKEPPKSSGGSSRGSGMHSSHSSSSGHRHGGGGGHF